MSLVFFDSFDLYNVQDQKWDVGSSQATIDLTNTKGRTGIGCLIVNSGFQGPLLNLNNMVRLLGGSAVFCNILGGAFLTVGNSVPPPDFYFTNVQLNINPDGSISATAWVGSSFVTVGTSSIGLITTNVYNYLEWDILISDAAGTIKVWLNNILVLNLSGVRTHSPQTSAGNPTPVSCNALRLLGAGGAGTWRHDDFYLIDPLVSPNTARLGPVRIYGVIPNADSTPLQWTPNAGLTHYTQVDEVPPDLGTTYVQDGTVGETDQYLYDVAAVPAGGTVPAMQHMLLSALDAAGAGSVGSSVNGVVTGSLALSTSYIMLRVAYDLDPSTGLPWTGVDLTTIKAGPSVTA